MPLKNRFIGDFSTPV